MPPAQRTHRLCREEITVRSEAMRGFSEFASKPFILDAPLRRTSMRSRIASHTVYGFPGFTLEDVEAERPSLD